MSEVLCRLAERPGAAGRLVCFPHAGGSASFFRDWAAALPDVEVYAVRYPGRAERLADPLPTDLMAEAADIAGAVTALAGRPLALFGHSMGAIVAFETARHLAARGVAITRLFVSGARAANDPEYAPAGLSDVDDDAIMAALAAHGGTDTELLADPMLRELVLDYVRADFEMFDRYTFVPGAPLDCPITTVNGTDDDHLPPGRAGRWAELTTGGLTERVFPGGHFYLIAHPPHALVRAALPSNDKAGQRS